MQSLSRTVVTLLVAAMLFALLAFGTQEPATARAASVEGLQVESSTVYRPLPVAGEIEVESTFTMTNVQPDEVVDGAVRSFFYTKWVIAVPASVTQVEATSDGTDLGVAVEPVAESPGIAFATIDLPFDLTFEQTVTVEVDYVIPGGEPREGPAGARVNDSFLSFSVWAVGDPGRTDIRIEIPAGFTVDLQGDLGDLQERQDLESPDATVLEALAIAQPERFFGQVYGRDDRGLITQTARLPDGIATVRAWPDDPEWADFVVDAIENDIPVLEDLIGLEWPAGDIEVIESVTPYLLGYGGWFNASSGVIEIGEALERDVILHELGHAWFNESLVGGRWITEGLAEEYAWRTIQATGNDLAPPSEPDLNDPIRVPLAQWASPWSLDEDDAFAYEAYHYNAAWWVIHQITDEIGTDAMSDVLVALAGRESAYPGDVPLDSEGQAQQWTQLYDLLDTRTAVSGLQDLFTTFVLPERDLDLFADRQDALAAYEQLATDDGEWTPPVGVRQALGAWDFTAADSQIDRALEVLAERDAILVDAQELAVVVDLGSVESQFEAAGSIPELEEAQARLSSLQVRLQQLAAARQGLVDRSAVLGASVEFDTGTLEEAELDIQDRRQAVDDLVELRRQVESTAEVLGVTPPAWPELGDAVGSDAAMSLAAARLSTLEAIAGAEFAVDGPRSLAEHIGLLARDPEADLAVARAAFEADRLDDSIAASARASAEIAQASSVGVNRIRATVIAAALVLMIGFLLARRRRMDRALPPVIFPPEQPRRDTTVEPAKASPAQDQPVK